MTTDTAPEQIIVSIYLSRIRKIVMWKLVSATLALLLLASLSAAQYCSSLAFVQSAKGDPL